VEKAIRSVPAITAADVDLDAHVAHLTSSEPAQAVKEAVAAIRQAGYHVATDQRRFDTTGITCGGCAKSVTTVLSALPGVLAVAWTCRTTGDRGSGERLLCRTTARGRPQCPPAIACCPKPFSTPPS
jgi:copper chaperone CopZ